MKPDCEKTFQVNQYHCKRCNTYWGMNDKDPPECLTDEQVTERNTIPFYDRYDIFRKPKIMRTKDFKVRGRDCLGCGKSFQPDPKYQNGCPFCEDEIIPLAKKRNVSFSRLISVTRIKTQTSLNDIKICPQCIKVYNPHPEHPNVCPYCLVSEITKS